jgi:hypothetical protein
MHATKEEFEQGEEQGEDLCTGNIRRSEKEDRSEKDNNLMARMVRRRTKHAHNMRRRLS